MENLYGSRLRIAVVDDDADIRQSVEEYLLDSNYSVWSAGNAEVFYKKNGGLTG